MNQPQDSLPMKMPSKLDNKYKETKAAELMTHHDKTISGIIGMGRILTEVKEALPHGEYTAWMRQHCRFSNATSLRYRRSFALATSIDDFANVKLETMALYFCAELHDELSKPILDPNNRTAIEAGFKAILKAARKHLIDEDEARAIYKGAVLKLAEVTNATAAKADIASLVEPSPSTATVEQKVTALIPKIDRTIKALEEVMRLIDEGHKEDKELYKLIEIARSRARASTPLQFPSALPIVMREQFDDEWMTAIKNVGEIEFRRHVDRMSAMVAKFDAENGAIKMKADRAEAKTKNKS
jgi:hypothetical protein